MKNILTLFLVSFFVQNVMAQSNTWLLYGNTSYSHSNTLDNNQETISDSYNFAPGIGYQFNKNRTAGLKTLVFRNRSS